MAGASLHPLLPSLKARVTALHQYGERLYVGLATGALQIYSFELATEEVEDEERGIPVVQLFKTHNVSRRPIDQLGFLPETNQLVILTDSMVTLHSVPDMTKKGIVTLSQARTAHCFDIASYTSTLKSKKSKNDLGADHEGETKVKKDLLVVGCRKKVVLYGLGKGGMKDGLELNLAHSPRTVIIQSSGSSVPDAAHLLYSPTTSAILHIDASSKQPLSVADLPNTPLPQPTAGPSGTSKESASGQVVAQEAAASGGGMVSGMGGAFSGLGGYVGLGAKSTLPVGTRTCGGEVLIGRQELGGLYSGEGNFTRQDSIQWATPPEALAYSNPFIYSVIPTIPSASTALPTPAINIHLGPTLLSRRPLPLPNPTAGTLNVTSLIPVSGMPSRSPADSLKASPKILFCSTPTDKTLLQNEGSTIWVLRAGDIGEEVDELLREGRSADAIGLVEAVGEAGLSPKRRLAHLKTLDAVSQFAKGNYQPAIDTFLVFNVNPALVISLFPAETISGPLHVARDKWMALFGAVDGTRLEPVPSPIKGSFGDDSKSVLRLPHLGLSKKSSMDTLKQETGSISSDGDRPAPPMSGQETMAPRAALEALMYFLSDRRQKLAGAIATNGIPSETSFSPLSSLDAADLHSLPSVPMAELEPEQLLRMAQIIYTALLKVYLVARPILVGSLCRIENWCDVHEVEGLLKAQKKFSDLIDLYQGKKMHDKALTMLEELAKEEDDPLDRYPPIVRYLQKLGPDHLETIFHFSKWIFSGDPKRGLSIFTADEPEVEALPRKKVVDFLEKTNRASCIGYLEHLVHDLHDDSAEFHDKLAELYLEKARNDEKAKAKLLEHLNASQHYRANRLLGKLKGEEMPEMKAILLGRMGKHDEALRIYVFRLEDYTSAEGYCSRIYASDTDQQDRSIFLLLLKIYLLPQKDQSLLLAPALSLLANHSTQMDPAAVLELLPPLVTMQEIRSFMIRTLRDGTRRVHERKVMKSLISARKEEVERLVMGLEVKRVRITDQRICPQCHKRLGQSAIAVHAPRGEVTHLHCKDPFSATLAKLRA